VIISEENIKAYTRSHIFVDPAGDYFIWLRLSWKNKRESCQRGKFRNDLFKRNGTVHCIASKVIKAPIIAFFSLISLLIKIVLVLGFKVKQ
jgi:hypothetical protein